MEKDYVKKIISAAIFLGLIILSFLLIKPILMATIIGIILAFIFSPVYDFLTKKTKSRNLSAAIICIFLLLLVILPFFFLAPVVLKESIKIYLISQQIDFTQYLEKFFPSLFSSPEFTEQSGYVINSFVNKSSSYLINQLSAFITNFPVFFLQSLIVFFVLFYTLRDRKMLVEYIKSILPFSKDVEKKLFDQSRDITISVLYGQIIVGLIQGLIVGIGFFIFDTSNAFFLTILACLAGIFPIIGTTLVWLPLAIYLLVAGNFISAIGIFFFGAISSSIDNFLKPIMISKRTCLHPVIILIGMIGGLFFFGVMGFILGPLVLAYLFIILELYRNKNTPGFIFQES